MSDNLVSRQYFMAAQVQTATAHLALARLVGAGAERARHATQALAASDAALAIYRQFGFTQVIECLGEEILLRHGLALAANGQVALGADFLHQAHVEMRRKHDLIPPDSPHRAHFLNNIPVHREIRSAFEAPGKSARRSRRPRKARIDRMTQTLKRDQLTWLMYFMLAGLAYQQGILGPLMPFLRESLDMNYTQGGVLVTAIALGMILTGLTSERVAQRVGRRAMLWGGAVGFVIGSWALAFSPTFETAFAAVLFNSVAGAMTMATVNATLSDHHGPLRTSALAEANVAAALSSSASPWLIGLFQSSGLGWQWSLLVTLGIIVAIAAVYGRVPIPDMPLPAHAPGAGARGLPIGFWVYWLVVIGVVAFEWCFVVWGADYLAAVVGLEPSLASALMGVYLGAMVIGRFVGSWLTRRWPPAIVLPAALVLALLGFPLFWTALTPSLAGSHRAWQ